MMLLISIKPFRVFLRVLFSVIRVDIPSGQSGALALNEKIELRCPELTCTIDAVDRSSRSANKQECMMSYMSLPEIIKSHTLFLGVALAGAFGLGFLQGMPPGPPIHAMAKINGNGWHCESGYLEVGSDCIADLSAPPDRPGVYRQAEIRPGGDALTLSREIDNLKEMINHLSLENAVLRAERVDAD